MQYASVIQPKTEAYEAGTFDDTKYAANYQINQLSRNMDDVRIITAVQKRRALYDKTDPRYSNRDAVRLFWMECALDVGMEVEPMKKRWAYLRDYFMKQHRVMKLAKSGLAVSRKKKWPLFDAMGFLVPFMQQRSSFPPPANGEEEEEDEVPPPNGAETDVSRPESPGTTSDTAPPPKRLALSETAPTASPCIRRLKPGSSPFHFDLNSPRLRPADDMDESEHFFKSLLPTLRRLNPVAALEFRNEVHNLLLKYVKSAAPIASVSTPVQSPGSPLSPDTVPQQTIGRPDDVEYPDGWS